MKPKLTIDEKGKWAYVQLTDHPIHLTVENGSEKE